MLGFPVFRGNGLFCLGLMMCHTREEGDNLGRYEKFCAERGGPVQWMKVPVPGRFAYGELPRRVRISMGAWNRS